MKKLQWLMFQPEGCDVIYLYNDERVFTMHVAEHEGKESSWFWRGPAGIDELDHKEILLLEEALRNKRKQLLKFPKRARRYQVIARGEYDYQNAPA
jgi:hypothetical protein